MGTPAPNSRTNKKYNNVMSKAKKYTIETLLPLNVSYDSDHGLTQEDVDMVNSLVEVIEGEFLQWLLYP